MEFGSMRIIRNGPKFLTYLGFIVLCLVMLWGVIGVVTGMFKHPVPNIVELTEVLMPICIFLPVAYAQILKRHIIADLVSQHFPPKMARVAGILTLFIQFLLLALIAWQSSLRAIRSIEIMEVNPVTSFPVYLYPGKVATALGTGIAAIAVFWQMVNDSVHFKTSNKKEV
jgi:TRAP-type C4-dicarboxylate transport system permease small subunit